MVTANFASGLLPPRASKIAIQSLRLFVSMDIVGSTQYKRRRPDEWQQPLKQFFQRVDAAVDELKQLDKEAVVWKRAGDEVILHFVIRTEAELREKIAAVYNLYHEIADRIGQSEFTLGVKAAAWLCPVDDVRNIEIYADDWIGLSMDEGFRIAHNFSAVRGFALSFELAYLLSVVNLDKYLFLFLGCQELKGVWNGRFYPVIWYTEPESKHVRAKIPYDAQFRNDFLANAITSKPLDGRALQECLAPILSEIPELQTAINEIQEYLVEASRDASPAQSPQ